MLNLRFDFGFPYMSMLDLINAATISALHQNKLVIWQNNAPLPTETNPLLLLIEENHSFNYQLWLAEDRARRDDKGYEFVYRAKREIDQHNQQRNNRMEAIDALLFKQLAPVPIDQCMPHSETPGMIIDRLSILTLKTFHMHLQTLRDDTEAQHQQQCSQKLAILKLQHQQLGQCLDSLLQGVLDKTQTFYIYQQFKMYNDAQLNPELYQSTT